MKTFKANATYTGRFVTDWDGILSATVISRSVSRVKVLFDGRTLTKKIHVHNDTEFFFPLGQYSMSPVIKAV